MEFSDFSYVPILGVRPAEMHAIEELTSETKSSILPLIVLRPWGASKEFENTLTKVAASTAEKQIIADLTSERFVGPRRAVHDTIDSLRDAANGYSRWRDFIENHVNFTPSIQLGTPHEVPLQIDTFKSLGRGVVIRLQEETFFAAEDISRLFLRYRRNSDVYFILDFKKQDRNILTKTLIASNVCRRIRAILPDCFISVSASTFPSSFAGITEQEIFERTFYRLVAQQIGFDKNIYCDRASVRAESQVGGGGAIPPRIDNALATKWKFFRELDEDDDREAAYQMAAMRAIACPEWQDLGIWGTEIIKRTSVGDVNGIYSQSAATSARINIHMHVQSGGRVQPRETEWTDL